MTVSTTRFELEGVLEGSITATLVRDVVVAVGPDTVKFLHSQLSQDLVSMAVGDVRWAFLLQPTGKLVALLRVVRSSEEAVILDTDAGHGEAVIDALARFKIRTKCDLTLRANVSFAASWTSRFPELVEAAGALPETVSDLAAVVRGFPRWGTELTDSTIPNATGLVDRAASFTKGCYTGQELVERIDSRGGNVPRRLVGVAVEASVEELGGDATLMLGGTAVGELTSVRSDPRTSQSVALAYVSRTVDENSALCTAGGHLALVVPLS